jgi:lysosomal acid lipase/cholesteryl ester hydrolase
MDLNFSFSFFSDVELLHRELPNVALKYLVPMPEFNHMDFVWAINVRSLLYERVFQSMREAEAMFP